MPVSTRVVTSVSVWSSVIMSRSYVRTNGEQLEQIVEHLAMLRGDADDAFDRRRAAASACTTGAILIVSGRVPNTVMTRNGRSFMAASPPFGRALGRRASMPPET